MHYFCCAAQIALVAFVFLFGPIHSNNWEPCGDWIQYNDEKCFKIIDDTLRTFDEAKNVCATQEQTSTLVVVRSTEEQQFLSNYLFKTEQKLDNFWIGAKYSVQNSSYIWIDNSLLNYSNWNAGQSPQSRANQCVHMQADENVTGKWIAGRCGKKNAVVCQRMQFWSTELIQKKFLDARKKQRDSLDTIQNLTQSLASANQRIEGLENLKQRINELKENLDNVSQKFYEQKQNLDNANQRINELQNSIVPIGFIYIQLAHQPDPKALWPTFQWQDVTSTYAGAFFRAEGGNSSEFGTVQGENVPRITEVTHIPNIPVNIGGYKWNHVHLEVGKWSDGVYSGHFDYSLGTVIKFLMSGGEVRPRNMAVRIWKRI